MGTEGLHGSNGYGEVGIICEMGMERKRVDE